MFCLPAGLGIVLPATSATPTLSIQNVSITLTAASSGTATITAVSSNASIHFCGYTTSSSVAQSAFTRVELTNSTTVTASRTGSTGNQTIKAVVIDWNSAWIQSVQNGTITITGGSTSNTATVSSVTTGNCAVIWLGNTLASGTTITRASTRLVLTDSTTITATRGNGSTDDCTVGYCLVEWKSAKVSSKQTFSATISAGNSTVNTTITAVASTGMMFYGGFSSTDTTLANHIADAYRNSTTNIVCTREGTSNATIVNGTVMEFTSDTTQSADRQEVAITDTNTTATYTYTATTQAKTLPLYTGVRTNGATALSSTLSHQVVTNTTTITGTRDGSTNQCLFAGEMWQLK